MRWKTSCFSRHLTGLSILLPMLGGSAHADTVVREPLRCVLSVSVPPTLHSEGLSELLADLPMNCTGGPLSGAGSSNLNLLLNTGVANTGTDMPLLTITHDQCSHLAQSIFCPPGVAPGTNSSFFDAAGNIVFPGIFQPTVTVSPGDIFPFMEPPPIFGTVNGNTVTWLGVPVDVQAKGHRVFHVSRIRANMSTFPGAPANGNLPLFGDFSSSSTDLNLVFPTSLSPGSSSFLLGVGMPSNSSPFCQSPLVTAAGTTPFVVVRQVSVSGNTFDGVITLSGPSPGIFDTLGLFTYAPSAPPGCQGSSVFNPATGALDLQNVFYQGQDYWGQANQSASGFALVRYGSGTMPPR